jgi:hypothetical protein
MKKLIICAALFLSATFFKEASAQLRVNVNFNIGSQPVWGPAGYDYAQYYYLPDIEAYYDVPNRQFIYMSGNRWVFSSSLPSRYRDYDLYSGYKVVVNRPRPYVNFNADRIKYSSYRGNHSQKIIRNSDDPKYYIVKGHPKYRGNHNEDQARNRVQDRDRDRNRNDH